jgi:lipopolysaccharide/colanic/teichoic acid biosynthesis glycosyltransferase
MTKRIFDFTFSLILIISLSWLMILLFIISCIKFKSFGLFFQERIGQYGKIFTIYKIKSMNLNKDINFFGEIIRKYKLDELPQLINILKGEMSFVGPRPDIAGYYDKLQGEEQNILQLKPGLTSRASIKYRNEEKLLKEKVNPIEYNDKIIFPDKIKMNLEYYYNHNFFVDLHIIICTIKYILKP